MLVASLPIYAFSCLAVLLLLVGLTYSRLLVTPKAIEVNNDDDDDLIHFDLSSISVRSFGESHSIELRLATDLEFDNED